MDGEEVAPNKTAAGNALSDDLAAFAGTVDATNHTTAWASNAPIVDALMTITVNPVGKGTGAVFDPDAIGVAWKVDL
jgi:hypothetical protein